MNVRKIASNFVKIASNFVTLYPVGDCYCHFVPFSKILLQSHCGEKNSFLDNGSMSDARGYADFLWLEALFQRFLQNDRLNAHADAAYVRLLCLRSSLFQRLRDMGKLLESDAHRDSGFDEAVAFVAMRRKKGGLGSYQKPSCGPRRFTMAIPTTARSARPSLRRRVAGRVRGSRKRFPRRTRSTARSTGMRGRTTTGIAGPERVGRSGARPSLAKRTLAKGESSPGRRRGKREKSRVGRRSGSSV